MTDNNPHINYSFADIERYLNGGMTAKEMHDLERAALQDPFLADAIDGYRVADVDITNRHLNEIAAALQKEEPAKVIAMPKKKNYNWLIAASIIAVTGISVFLLLPQNNKPEPLANNTVSKNQSPDSVAENEKAQVAPSDSQPGLSSELATAKAGTETRKKMTSTPKEKPSGTNEKTPASEPVLPSAENSSGDVAMTYRAPAPDLKVSAQKQPASLSQDTTMNGASAQANARFYTRQQAKAANTWTTDKGKPFRLSDVEVINIGKKARKKIDTASVKPEGGWQSFQDYLFSRLSRHDSLQFVNNNSITGNLELEFSIDESGSPYDIKVLHAQDSTISNKIADAVQTGPKWTNSDKKEKRLRLRY